LLSLHRNKTDNKINVKKISSSERIEKTTLKLMEI